MIVNNRLIYLSKKAILIVLILFWTATFFKTIQAQESVVLEKIRALKLHNLNGEVKVYYSNGYTKRAAYLQELAEAASHYLQKPEIIAVKLNLTLTVLGPEDWTKSTKLPYGIPHILPESLTVILPASEKNVLSKGILAYKDSISEKTLKRFKDLDISFEDAASTFVDLIGFHEIGHLYAHAYVTFWPSEKWLNEFIATYLAYAFMKESKPKFAKLWETMHNANVESHRHEHTTLSDFEQLYIGVGIENYEWYQGKFQQMVEKVFEKLGISFIHTLKRSLSNNPKASKNDPFRLQEMNAIYEGFTAWAKGPDGNLK